MNDEEIEKLAQEVAKAKLNGEFVAWRTELPTRHDGMGLTGSHYMPVFRTVVSIGECEGEPVAFLDDGYGDYVALWCSEPQEFFVIKKVNYE